MQATENKLTAQLRNIPTAQLKKIVAMANDSFEDGTDEVLHYGMAELDKRLNDDEFFAFMETLD